MLSSKEETLAGLQEQMHQILIRMPNMLAPDVPDGQDDTGNVEIKKVGKIPTFDFKIRDHQELGELLDILDIPRGAKVAQAGFYYWKGKGAILAQSLYFWVQRVLVERGFTMFMTPVWRRSAPSSAPAICRSSPTRPTTSKGRISLSSGLQSRRWSATTPTTCSTEQNCRSATPPSPPVSAPKRAATARRRGGSSAHQFHKVEQIIFCKPEDSPKYHEFCLANEEYILQQLGIPYHVVNVCVGDLGAPGYKKYDIEAWFAGFGAYREVTSNTNLTSFQSRRLNIRYKDGDTRDYVHTISATAVTDRVLIAIMENFQQEDGTVIVPEVLRPLCGFDRIEPAKK
ncbi:MAG: hypothetical protein L6W00_13040 [Lentisphaeria bacterium]|nr:MAG: hypothetical protein L6W00_13040 [Lentisphaeria bacterium]